MYESVPKGYLWHVYQWWGIIGRITGWLITPEQRAADSWLTYLATQLYVSLYYGQVSAMHLSSHSNQDKARIEFHSSRECIWIKRHVEFENSLQSSCINESVKANKYEGSFFQVYRLFNIYRNKLNIVRIVRIQIAFFKDGKRKGLARSQHLRTHWFSLGLTNWAISVFLGCGNRDEERSTVIRKFSDLLPSGLFLLLAKRKICGSSGSSILEARNESSILSNVTVFQTPRV